MMSSKLIFPVVLISILLLAEFGSFFALRSFVLNNTTISPKKFTWIWWISSVSLYFIVFGSRMLESTFSRNVIVNFFFIILITKLVISLTFIISLLVNFIRSLFESIPEAKQEAFLNSRRKFVSRLAVSSAVLPLAGLSWGIFYTAHNFKVHREKIRSARIPSVFKGFRILQISDIHTGSIQRSGQLQKAIDLIKLEKPDLIVFTGDLVNNRTDEVYEYMEILKEIKAPYGVYSTLGNHDYGDYESWEKQEDKDENMRAMIDVHHKLGWKLMLNEQVRIEKDGQYFSLIGIENWGANLSFKKYGDLAKAVKEVDQDSFQVLLSHDPSHWRVQVIEEFKSIDLTLSGHTHGFQFGVEIPGMKWSPSQYIYPHWAGMYREGEQMLYVNRGLGCLGYMGRIGIRPEITVFEFT